MAFWQEARGLQVIECPAARALDLQFGEAAGSGKFTGAMTTTYFKHVGKPLASDRLPSLARELEALVGLQVLSANRWLVGVR